MNEGTDWLPTTCYKPGVGNGTPVKRGLQLGYAKMAGIEQEKLASDLAKLIRVPVPHVEISAVAGHPCAISYVHSPDSYPLAIKGSFVQQAFSPVVKHALKLATGLLSFFAWIGTTDHYDDTNLVVDKLGNGLCRVVAIDFGDAFPWASGAGRDDEIDLSGPPSLEANFDPALVTQSLTAIENLGRSQINACCAVFERERRERIEDVLQRRQCLLRAEMVKRKWLS